MSTERAIQAAVVRLDMALTSPWLWVMAAALVVVVVALSRWR